MSRTFISSRFMALSTLTGPRWRRPRRTIGRALKTAGMVLYWVAGGPLALGRFLMRLGGRANGLAYEVERDR